MIICRGDGKGRKIDITRIIEGQSRKSDRGEDNFSKSKRMSIDNKTKSYQI